MELSELFELIGERVRNDVEELLPRPEPDGMALPSPSRQLGRLAARDLIAKRLARHLGELVERRVQVEDDFEVLARAVCGVGRLFLTLLVRQSDLAQLTWRELTDDVGLRRAEDLFLELLAETDLASVSECLTLTETWAHVAAACGVLPACMGAIPEDSDHVLIIAPTGKLQDPQLDALRQIVGYAPPGGELFLPRVALKGGAEQVAAAQAALQAEGLEAATTSVKSVLTDAEPWWVSEVRLDNDKVVVQGVEGTVALDPTLPVTLLRGDYSVLPRQEGGRLDMRRLRVSTTRLQTMRRVGFLHMYTEGNPRPYAFVSSKLLNFNALGDALQPAREANFQALCQLLVDRFAAPVDDRLQRYNLSIGSSLEPLLSSLQQLRSDSPDPRADLASRLLMRGA